MNSVLGIDLGLSWQSTGSAVVSFDGDLWLRCTLGPIVWPETECNAGSIAASVVEFALRNRIAAVSFDGPQGWRDPVGAGTFVGRECERLTRTPGKTGTFGVSIPGTWIHWIRSSIHVFDALLDSGHAIMASGAEQQLMPPLPEGSFYVLECFPTSTWRSAGLQSLPGHHIDLPTVWRFAQNLQMAFGLPDLIASYAPVPLCSSGYTRVRFWVLPENARYTYRCQLHPPNFARPKLGAQSDSSNLRTAGFILPLSWL